MRILISAVAATMLAAPALAQTAANAPAASSAPSAGQALLDQRIDEVVAVLLGKRPADQVFAPAFLAQVPAAQIAAMQSQFTASYGALAPDGAVTMTAPLQGDFVLRFAKAEARGTLVLSADAPHQVIGLQVLGVTPVGDSAQALAKDLSALPGTVNAWFGPLAGGEPVLALNAERPLALGSTFKLYVLAALQRAIKDGPLRWDSIVRLENPSYPSGLIQDWPAGSPLTVQSLATLMIQISDNTATDQLIRLLGRDRIEAELRRTNRDPARSLPFLTTRELFVIKSDPALRARYAAADAKSRKAMLDDVAQTKPPLATIAAAFAGPPLAVDKIEWFADAPSLAALMREFTGPDATVARGILAANSGLGPDTPKGWRYLGFKGGSEPGVLNLTWLLQDDAGGWHLATVGWNNPAAPVDQARLVALAKRMLALTD